MPAAVTSDCLKLARLYCDSLTTTQRLPGYVDALTPVEAACGYSKPDCPPPGMKGETARLLRDVAALNTQTVEVVAVAQLYVLRKLEEEAQSGWKGDVETEAIIDDMMDEIDAEHAEKQEKELEAAEIEAEEKRKAKAEARRKAQLEAAAAAKAAAEAAAAKAASSSSIFSSFKDIKSEAEARAAGAFASISDLIRNAIGTDAQSSSSNRSSGVGETGTMGSIVLGPGAANVTVVTKSQPASSSSSSSSSSPLSVSSPTFALTPTDAQRSAYYNRAIASIEEEEKEREEDEDEDESASAREREMLEEKFEMLEDRLSKRFDIFGFPRKETETPIEDWLENAFSLVNESREEVADKIRSASTESKNYLRRFTRMYTPQFEQDMSWFMMRADRIGKHLMPNRLVRPQLSSSGSGGGHHHHHNVSLDGKRGRGYQRGTILPFPPMSHSPSSSISSAYGPNRLSEPGSLEEDDIDEDREHEDDEDEDGVNEDEDEDLSDLDSSFPRSSLYGSSSSSSGSSRNRIVVPPPAMNPSNHRRVY